MAYYTNFMLTVEAADENGKPSARSRTRTFLTSWIKSLTR